MHKQKIIAGFFLASLVASLAACGGGYSGGSGSNYSPPGSGGGGTQPAGVGAMTIGFALPDGTIGQVNDPRFGPVGGYTQTVYSQTIAFPPGTVVTLKNLSASTDHTLNVLSTTSFPASPALSTSASGGNTLAAGYASGVVHGGGTLSLMLANAGTYYIGCAFHYNDAVSMRDVIQVSAAATPGPQATPQAGTGGGTGGTGGCTGPYC